MADKAKKDIMENQRVLNLLRGRFSYYQDEYEAFNKMMDTLPENKQDTQKNMADFYEIMIAWNDLIQETRKLMNIVDSDEVLDIVVDSLKKLEERGAVKVDWVMPEELN
jgi:hypothetical protein